MRGVSQRDSRAHARDVLPQAIGAHHVKRSGAAYRNAIAAHTRDVLPQAIGAHTRSRCIY